MVRAMENTVKPSPIEVWLRQNNMQVACTVVHEDETTDELSIDSLSMRGAQREITGYLIKQGYAPVGRWESEALDREDDVEVSRQFRIPAPGKAILDAIVASAPANQPMTGGAR